MILELHGIQEQPFPILDENFEVESRKLFQKERFTSNLIPPKSERIDRPVSI